MAVSSNTTFISVCNKTKMHDVQIETVCIYKFTRFSIHIDSLWRRDNARNVTLRFLFLGSLPTFHISIFSYDFSIPSPKNLQELAGLVRSRYKIARLKHVKIIVSRQIKYHLYLFCTYACYYFIANFMVNILE